jgi:hypothetical protein
MNPNLRMFLRGSVLAAAMSSRLIAAEPMPSSGHVLVFENGGVLEGEVERVGERFRIRGAIGETWIPAKGVLGVAADREAAFQLMKQRAKPNDPKEHGRLARWCQSQGLKARAVEEAEAALAMKPEDRSFRYLRDQMKAFAAMPQAPSAPAVPMATHPVAADNSAIDVNPESLGLFVAKVQPILMNACAKCHTGESAGKFHLVRSETPDNPKAMHANLSAVSAMIDRQQPAASLLLVKSVTVHGEMGGPPLKDRQTAAYKHLENWVKLATENSQMTATPPAPLAPAVMADAQPLPPNRSNTFASDADVKTAAAPAKPSDPPLIPPNPPPPALPKALPPPVLSDPFDPAIFNQANGPKKP